MKNIMPQSLYNPFADFRFDNKTCFLTGEPATTHTQVFPAWLMRRYGLEDKPLKLLDESIRTYGSFRLPCSEAVAKRIEALEATIEAAFASGYDAVDRLDKVVLFQWIAKLVYGMVFNEIQTGVRQYALSGEPMNFSQVLVHKFRNLHLMLQSIARPVQFDGALPFTIAVTRVANEEGAFSYRDEINTLVFSLRMGDFGIVACLQDNGANGIYHNDCLTEIGRHTLHPIQFEELCARFFYSAYLFARLPEYTVLPTADTVYIEPLAFADAGFRPVFDAWQAKTYGQVLENFWKPWGYTLFEIIKDPENPMSFLLDAQGHLRAHDQLDLPKA